MRLTFKKAPALIGAIPLDLDHLAEHRFGTAGFADAGVRAAAGLHKPDGLFCGLDEDGRPIFSGGQAAVLVSGGARGLKGSLIVPWLTDGAFSHSVVNMDWKGQNGALAALQVAQGRHVINWNPRGVHGLAGASIDVLSYIHANSKTLEGDILGFGAHWLPSKPGTHAAYFEEMGQHYICGGLDALVRERGRVSLPMLADKMMALGNGTDNWLELEFEMSQSPHGWVRELVETLKERRQQVGTESGGFAAIKNEVVKSFRPLTDPQLRAAVSNPTFCLSELTKPGAPPIMLNIQEQKDFARMSSPVIRALYHALLVYKKRSPIATTRPQLWCLDEVGNIEGGWPMAKDLATEYAGYGIRAAFIVQSTEQLNNIVPNGARVIPNSCGTQIFTAIRDHAEATMVSKLIGQTTIRYNDTMAQERARHAIRRSMIDTVLHGGDLIRAAADIPHHRRVVEHRTAAPRQIRNPDEIMNAREGTAYVFMRGKLERPIEARIPPYWQRRDLAGRYLGDPFHNAPYTVEIATSRGQQVRRIIEQRPPRHLAHLPQYQDQPLRYVEGFRP